MAETILNQSGLNFEICEDQMVVLSNEVEATELVIIVTKTQSCPYFVVGGTITYCTTIENQSEIPLEDLKWFDNLDQRLTYVEDSFLVDGTQQTPTIDGQELSFNIDTIDINQTITICFKVQVGATV
ncbi:MAG: hypothetical protein FWB72_01225 [Firmicutes bacterium]|nr:hypothetical protein [Bacillota bacterium]